MPSIFSRSKASSSSSTNAPKLQLHRAQTPDEFGQIPGIFFGRSATPISRDKDKESRSKRQRTVSAGPNNNNNAGALSSSDGGVHPSSLALDQAGLPALPDGSFLPLVIPPKKQSTLHEYGYIGSETDVFLGLEEVTRLADVVSHELSTRGVTTPFLFSTQALDVSSTRVRSLIRAFLTTCQPSSAYGAGSAYLDLPQPSSAQRRSPNPIPSDVAESRWREEARLSGPHELAMLLKWGLARVARVNSGFEVRGFLNLDDYFAWRVQEEELNYPSNHFPTILNLIPPETHPLFNTLFALLSRFCAYSSSSGLTPQTLATHFGPLLFGLGPPSLPFGPTYAQYLRSVHATEHLLLAHIVNADFEAHNSVELPIRLKSWIKGYPVMIPRRTEELERGRAGVRTVRVASVRRNVRLYSPDLVQTATIWCGEGDLSGRKEWTRVVPSQSGEYSQPRYTEDFRKRLDLPSSFEPKTHNDPSSSSLRPSESTSNFSLSPPQAYRNPIDDLIARMHPESAIPSTLGSAAINEDRFRNLADLKWSQFSESGFSAPDSKLLQFDLGETARRNARNATKRESMTWSDFSQSGFDRAAKPLTAGHDALAVSFDRAGTPQPSLSSTDSLSDALKFSVPVESSTSWSEHSYELTRKLRKQQKVLPPFGWDTAAVAGREWVVEEGMIQTWCELCLSSGWVDRAEGTFREANWALTELKALPEDSSSIHQPSSRDGSFSDPRTSSQWFLFEEFVPREYREQLQNPKKKTSLFASLNKQKAWKPASTLNGQPYTGRPRSPNPKDFEFDAMLRHSESKTKILSLSTPPPGTAGSAAASFSRAQTNNAYVDRSNAGSRPGHAPAPVSNTVSSRKISAPLYAPQPVPVPERAPPPKSNVIPPIPSKPSAPLTRFRVGRARPAAAQWDPSIDFETRTASDSSIDDPVHPPSVPPKTDALGRPIHHQRQRSKDDAWVDILILESSGKSSTNSDELLHPGTRKVRSKSDPEKAREEIQRAMEAGGNFRMSTDDPEPRMDLARPMAPSPGSHLSYDEEPEVMQVPATIVPPPDIRVRSATVSTAATALEQHRHLARGQERYSEEGNDIEPVYIDEGDDGERSTQLDDDEPSPPPSIESRDVTPRTNVRIPLPASPRPPAKVLPPPPPPALTEQRAPGPLAPRPAVSSLIQMYQKKDEAAIAAPALISDKPSRLPVSVRPPGPIVVPSSPSPEPHADLPKFKPSGIPVSVKPITPPRYGSPSQVAPAPTVKPVVGSSPAPPQDILEYVPPPVLELEPRVPSPARYVHGAPLHNVIEDEEYEEEE